MSNDAQKQVLFEDDDVIFDQSRRAESVLDRILRGDLEESKEEASDDGAKVDIKLERKARPIIDVDTGRTASRVLFVTSDTAALTKESATQREYVALAEHFDEVHVLVLVNRRGADTSIRCGDHTWVYAVHGPYWWSLPFKGRSAAEEMLIFNDSVRPDIVVGVDPFEAGLTAYLIAGSFARPLQIHVQEDFTARAFLERARHNKWRARLARYVLKRTKSVRTHTDSIKTLIEKRFKNVIDVDVLPRFHNFSKFMHAEPTFNVHEKYKDFAFIALAFGTLTADSKLHDTFAALHFTLQNPRIGLIVIGTGPAKQLFDEKVSILGIQKSVVFLPAVEDLASYMRTADALIETDTSRESEEHVLRAAAAGLPLIAASTDLREDLFKDGASAFLCPAGDVQCIAQKFRKFMNSPALRKQFGRTSEQIAQERLVEDVGSYYRAFRDTIEVILETTAPVPEKPIEPTTKTHMSGRTVGPDGMSYPNDFENAPA